MAEIENALFFDIHAFKRKRFEPMQIKNTRCSYCRSIPKYINNNCCNCGAPK